MAAVTVTVGEAEVAIKSRSKSRLAGLIVPFFLAGVLIFGYYLYWTKVAGQIETRVSAALAQGRASNVKVTGFPYRLTLDVRNLILSGKDSPAFIASSLTATASPFNPSLWVLEAALNPSLALSSGPIRPLKAENLRASLRIGKSGLERFSLTFEGVNAGGEQGWRVGKGYFHLVCDPKNSDVIALALDVNNIALSKPMDGPGAIMGAKISHIRVAGPITKAQALQQSLQEWSNTGGKFQVMASEIMWGPVGLTSATGNLYLSDSGGWNGQLSGQGSLRPEGIAVAGLTGPVTLELKQGKLSLSGLPSLSLSDALQ